MHQVFQKYIGFILIICLSVVAFPSVSQSNNVGDVEKKANELFQKENYLEAKDLYSQLVSLYPKDANFNYRFGACLLFVDVDKTYPLKFLEYAVSKPNVDVEAFYFLGKGYHYNYRFDEAISYFRKFKSKLDVKTKSKYPVDHDIRFCENGKSLLVNITNPLVIEKRKVSVADFFTSFKLSEMGGRMMYAPKELQSSVDKKKGYLPVMYKNENSNYVYFSSYGNTEKNGLDIFRVHVSDNGVIGKPVRLPESINTKYHERFPFLTKDRSVFYFSSSGHNSMGGADIFSASYDTINNTYSQITNLDYSVNTPDDDFMYAEVGNGIAYFASTRNSEKGKGYVYKINANRKAYDIAVLAGVFDSENTRSCKITVEDLEDHVIVGSFNTNKKSGEYVMRLKNGGKYSFLVEPFGGETAYKGRVELPMQEDIKLLKQEIQIVKDGEREKLIIRNLFEETANPEDQKVIAQVLVESADIKEEMAPEVTISGDEIISEIEEQIKNEKSTLDVLKNKKNASFQLANTKRELAHKDLELADQLEKQISLNDQSEENKAKQREFSELVKDAKIHSQEAAIAYEMGKSYEKEISDAQTSINESEGYLTRIKESNNNDNQADVLDLYATYNNETENINVASYNQEVENSLEAEKQLMSASLKNADSYDLEYKEVQNEIKTKKAELIATKKKKEKEVIQTQIDALELELDPLQKEKDNSLKQAADQEVKINQLATELALLNELSGINSTESISEMGMDEKQAMLASIEATNQEIQALEEATKDLQTTDSNVESQIVENAPTSDTAGSNIDTADLIEPENEEGMETVSADNTNVEVEGAELAATAGVVESKESGSVNSENETETNADNNVDSQENSNSSDEFFAYTTEYEKPADNVIVVEGQSIPLDITSNTGKLQYTAEELAQANVVLDTSPYNEDFQNEFSKTKDITDSRAKARETQRINYNWVVAIEKEIAELEYAKTQSANSGYNSNLNSKVVELKDQAAQKRNFMALNAKIIKQLDEQEEETEELVAEELSVQDSASNQNVNVGDLNSELTENLEENTASESLNSENPSANGDSNVIVATAEPVTNVEDIPAEEAVVTSVDEEGQIEESSNPMGTDQNSGSEMAEAVTETNQSESSNEPKVAELNENEQDNQLESESTNHEPKPVVIPPLEEDLTPVQQAEISPSAVVVTQIEIEKENQEVVIQSKQNDLNELNTELEVTKKKKEKNRIASEIAVKEADVAYEQRKLQLVEQKTVDVTSSQDAMIADPLGERPSDAKYSEIRKLKSATADFQLELEEKQDELANTKKKKHRRVLEAEIVNIKRELALSQLETQMAMESVEEMEVVEEETLKKLTPYGTEVMIKIPELETDLTSEQMKEVEVMDAFVEYSTVKKESDKEIESAQVLYNSSTEKKKQVAQIEEEISLIAQGIELLSVSEQDSLIQLVQTKRTQQKKLIAEAEVMYQEGKVLENNAYFNLNEANSELLTLDNGEERALIFAAINGNVKEEVEPFDSTNIDAIPSSLNTDIFVDNDSTFYNETKPIPVDVELPKGVILKVQIGAFRNPINQSTFKGFAPIVGEKTNSGLTRYTAGLFKDFETADNAKNSIRGKGYSDAFVVAYLDGERISISEARRVLSGEISESQVAVEVAAVNNSVQPETKIEVNEITPQQLTPGSGDVQVQDANTRGELYFTVQVGVYSNKIQPGSVLSLSPLNSENIPNNLVRYSTGVYGSIAQASQARTRIVQLGISDAFVTAYYQGKRIPLSEARTLVASRGTVTNNSTVVQNSTSGTPDTGNSSTNNSGGSNSTPSTSSGFYVQVGPYSGGIPIDQAREILQLNSLGVVVEKNNNATLYKIGNFTSREEAEAIKTQLESKGLASPTVLQNEQ